VAVIPAFNEERSIGSVVALASPHVDEVIVVDDGSTDRTAQIAASMGARVMTQQNEGYGSAIQHGFSVALAIGADYVVLLDADMQHDPAEIPSVLAPVVEDDADMAIGNRFAGPGAMVPRVRRLGQSVFTSINNLAGGVNVADSQNGFRAFSREALMRFGVLSDGMGFASEMLLAARDVGLRVAEVHTKVRYFEPGKRNLLAHGVEVADTVLSLVARRRPLLFFSVPGVFTFVAGVTLGAHVINHMARTGDLQTGTSILTALLVIGGLLLGVTGVLLNSFNELASRISAALWQRMGRSEASVPAD